MRNNLCKITGIKNPKTSKIKSNLFLVNKNLPEKDQALTGAFSATTFPL